jgi:hypothetical protein
MKNIFTKSFIILLVLGLFTAFLTTNCKKKSKDFPFVITAKYQLDTNVTIPFADIKVMYGDVNIIGKTDVSGQFPYTYNLEAILDVYITKDTTALHDSTRLCKGQGVVRLKEGETVYKTIFVK